MCPKSLQSYLILCNPMDWTVACQAPLSMRFFRQGYWSGLPCPPPGDLPNPRIKPASLMSPAVASEFFTTSTTWETPTIPWCLIKFGGRELVGLFTKPC